MLKLQKKGKQEIQVFLRKRESLWSRSFICALSIALGLHIFAILIFQIHAYFNPNDSILPPIIVQADIGNFLTEEIIASLEEQEIQYSFLIPAEASLPQFPSLSTSQSESPLEYLKEESLLHNSFTSIEEDWQYLFDSPNQRTPHIKINISGDLAETTLIEDGIKNIKWNGKSQRVVYAVQVEGKTGRIFWQMEKEGTHNLAEQILSEIRFSQNNDSFVQTGQIEILFMGT